MCISSNDPQLTNEDAKGAQASPWVIAMKAASIPVLPHIINAVILTSATSSANAFLYTGSRYLFGIAQNRHAPRFLLKCSKTGVPYYCVGITCSISLLTYLSVGASAAVVFSWFQRLTTIAQLFTWCSICFTYTRFRKALAAQGVDRSTLIFSAKFQPYTQEFPRPRSRSVGPKAGGWEGKGKMLEDMPRNQFSPSFLSNRAPMILPSFSVLRDDGALICDQSGSTK